MLELGTFYGYSALCMAEGLEEGGRIVTCGGCSRIVQHDHTAGRRYKDEHSGLFPLRLFLVAFFVAFPFLFLHISLFSISTCALPPALVPAIYPDRDQLSVTTARRFIDERCVSAVRRALVGCGRDHPSALLFILRVYRHLIPFVLALRTASTRTVSMYTARMHSVPWNGWLPYVNCGNSTISLDVLAGNLSWFKTCGAPRS